MNVRLFWIVCNIYISTCTILQINPENICLMIFFSISGHETHEIGWSRSQKHGLLNNLLEGIEQQKKLLKLGKHPNLNQQGESPKSLQWLICKLFQYMYICKPIMSSNQQGCAPRLASWVPYTVMDRVGTVCHICHTVRSSLEPHKWLILAIICRSPRSPIGLSVSSPWRLSVASTELHTTFSTKL